MQHAPNSNPPAPSEWSRSGRYFLIALILHGALLFVPFKLAGDRPETPPQTVLVRLKEAMLPNPAPIASSLPAAAPEPKPVARPPQAHSVVADRPETPPPRAVVAMAPEQVTAPSAFTVPAPTTAPATSANAPVMPASAPAPVNTPARFDAAYLDNPKPLFPAISRRLGEEGRTLLRVRVSRDGLPLTVDLEKSSNFERLDEAARQTVARWKFVPARRGDEPVEATVIVPIVFRLDS